MTLAELADYGVTIPPTQDELPYSDGIPMESQRHVLQMQMLIDILLLLWAERQDVFVGGNMFVYYSLEQVRNKDFNGPDVFVVLDVPRRERKSWVVWEEGKAPDLVIELLSESTAIRDKVEKKQVYQNRLRVPNYFWFDPFSGELAGFALQNGVYTEIQPDAQNRLISQQLGLALVRWEGIYQGVTARWLRWETLEGDLLPTAEELASLERQRAEEATRQMQAAQLQAAELESMLARYRDRFGELPD
ncbi:Uma2 family endonuclease [Trichocoleus sp. FACHB-69]|nr:Uma2 family endonuclease [Trichocoleus sp. FACHB-69]